MDKTKKYNKVKVFFHTDTLEAEHPLLRSCLRCHPRQRQNIPAYLTFKEQKQNNDGINKLYSYAKSKSLVLEHYKNKQEIQIEIPKHQLSNAAIHGESPSVDLNHPLSFEENGKIALLTFLGDVVFRYNSSHKDKNQHKQANQQGVSFLKGYVKTITEKRIPDYRYEEVSHTEYDYVTAKMQREYIPELSGAGQCIGILNIGKHPRTECICKDSTGKLRLPLSAEVQLLQTLLPEARIVVYNDVSMLSALKTSINDAINAPDIIINPYSGYQADYTGAELTILKNSLLKACLLNKTILSYKPLSELHTDDTSVPSGLPWVLQCLPYSANESFETSQMIPVMNKKQYYLTAAKQFNIMFWAAQVAKLNQKFEFKLGYINDYFHNALVTNKCFSPYLPVKSGLLHTDKFENIHHILYKYINNIKIDD
ncbi:MAG: hypothetical protein ACLFM1_04560 [Bacteroidales bacterium]